MTPTDTARAWLADPDCVVLDFETTALDGYAVEMAVCDMQGEPVLCRRLHPRVDAIDPRAQAVHGITLDSLAGEAGFGDVLEDVRRAVGGRNVVAYNATFDAGVFQREVQRLGLHGDTTIAPQQWRCAMHVYSAWVGDPGRYGGYRWQRLPGGDHSALGDCRAALEVLRRVAAGPAPTARYR